MQNEADLKTEQWDQAVQQVQQLLEENGQLRSLLSSSEVRAEDYWRRLQRAEAIGADL